MNNLKRQGGHSCFPTPDPSFPNHYMSYIRMKMALDLGIATTSMDNYTAVLWKTIGRLAIMGASRPTSFCLQQTERNTSSYVIINK
jgi:hypothetical protein